MQTVASILSEYYTEQIDFRVGHIDDAAVPVKGYFPTDPERTNQLRQSIEAHGMQRPLIVATSPWNSYVIITGYERYKAVFWDAEGNKRPDLIVPVILVHHDSEIDTVPDFVQLQIDVLDNFEQKTYSPYWETIAMVKLFKENLIHQVPELEKATHYGQHHLAWPSRLLRTFATKDADARHATALEYNLSVNQVDNAIQSMLRLANNMKLTSFVNNLLPLITLQHEDLKVALANNRFPVNAATAVDKITDPSKRAMLIELAREGMGYRKILEQVRVMRENENQDIVPADQSLRELATRVRKLLRNIPALHRENRDRLAVALQEIIEALNQDEAPSS